MSEPRPLILVRRRDHPQGDITGKVPPAGVYLPPDISGKVPGPETPERLPQVNSAHDDAELRTTEGTFSEVSYPPRYRVGPTRQGGVSPLRLDPVTVREITNAILCRLAARQFLADLRARGVELVADGDRLMAVEDPPATDKGHPLADKDRPRWRPPEAVLIAEELKRFRTYRGELRRLLAGPQGRPSWPSALPGLGPRDFGPFAACRLCGVGSWARYGGNAVCEACASGPAVTLLTYQDALRRWWEMTAQGPRADRVEITRSYQEILRLMDEVGEPQGTRLRRQWARQWWQETGVCPFCAERGSYHDPHLGGEAP